MSELLDELQEDLKDERIISLWRRYGNMIINAIVMIVFSTIGWVSWDYYHESKLVRLSDQYELALKDKAALEAFAKEAAGTGYGYLAKVRLLSFDPSVAAYDGAAAKDLQNIPYYGLLRLTGALLSLKKDQKTEAPQSFMSPQHPWKGIATELLFYSLLKDKLQDKAVPLYKEALQSRDIPESIKYRLSLLASVYELRIDQ